MIRQQLRESSISELSAATARLETSVRAITHLIEVDAMLDLGHEAAPGKTRTPYLNNICILMH